MFRIRLTVLVVSLAGCSGGPKGDILDVRAFSSPDGRLLVTTFGETFYNTTGYIRHIDLHRAGEKPGYPGNVYLVGVGSEFSVSWTSPTNVLVQLRFETRRAVPTPTNVLGVQVVFQEMRRQ